RPLHSPEGGLWPERRRSMGRSRRASVNRQSFYPDRETHRRNGIGSTKPCEQIIIATTRNKGVAGALGIGKFEDKTGVVVESAADRCRKAHAFDVDATRLQKSCSALELVERRCKRRRHIGMLGQRAQRGGGAVGIVLDREKALDEVSH